MKVYIAECVIEYEGFEIIGVYSTWQAAEDACEQHKNSNNGDDDGYDVEDFEVHNNT